MMHNEILISWLKTIILFWIWIEMKKLDWQSQSNFDIWYVNQNLMHQIGFRSRLSDPAIQSSDTLNLKLTKFWKNSGKFDLGSGKVDNSVRAIKEIIMILKNRFDRKKFAAHYFCTVVTKSLTPPTKIVTHLWTTPNPQLMTNF